MMGYSCVQVKLIGTNGTASPASVSIPGYLTLDSPGLKWIPKKYKPPKPRPYKFKYEKFDDPASYRVLPSYAAKSILMINDAAKGGINDAFDVGKPGCENDSTSPSMPTYGLPNKDPEFCINPGTAPIIPPLAYGVPPAGMSDPLLVPTQAAESTKKSSYVENPYNKTPAVSPIDKVLLKVCVDVKSVLIDVELCRGII
jgi:hypothetical protein